MSQFPSLPLFTDAFIADTGHLTAQETGAYLMLLMVAWRSPECRLPDDDYKLSRWARVDRRTWTKIKPNVMSFWILENAFWKQKRLSKERAEVSRRAEVARSNGATGGRPKSLKSQDTDNRAGSCGETQGKPPSPSPSPSPITNAAALPAGTRDDLVEIERRCREAAGALENPALALKNLKPILAWLDAGFSLEEDILPVIRRKAPAALGSWSYFTKALQEALDASQQAVAAAQQAARNPNRRGGFNTRKGLMNGLLAMDEQGNPPKHRPNFSDPVTRALHRMSQDGTLAAMEAETRGGTDAEVYAYDPEANAYAPRRGTP